MPDRPEPGEVWEHFKGGVYIVLHVALDSSGEEVVVYREWKPAAKAWTPSAALRLALDDPTAVWSTRPLKEWHEREVGLSHNDNAMLHDWRFRRVLDKAEASR